MQLYREPFPARIVKWKSFSQSHTSCMQNFCECFVSASDLFYIQPTRTSFEKGTCVDVYPIDCFFFSHWTNWIWYWMEIARVFGPGSYVIVYHYTTWMADIGDTFSEMNSGSKAGLINFSSIISSDSSLNVLVPRIHAEWAYLNYFWSTLKGFNPIQARVFCWYTGLGEGGTLCPLLFSFIYCPVTIKLSMIIPLDKISQRQ